MTTNSVYTDYFNQFSQDAQLDATIDVTSIPAFIAWLDANAITDATNTTTASVTSLSQTNVPDLAPPDLTASNMIN